MKLKELLKLQEERAKEWLERKKQIDMEQPKNVKITATKENGKEIKEPKVKIKGSIDLPTFLPYNNLNTKDKLEQDAERYAIIMTGNKPNTSSTSLKKYQTEYINMVKSGEWGPKSKPPKYTKKLETLIKK